MYIDIRSITEKTLDNPSLTFKELNTVIEFLKYTNDLLLQQKPVIDDGHILIEFNENLPAYSIVTIQHGTEVFYFPEANPAVKKAPGTLFATNSQETLVAPTVYRCHILGTHRPHLIRYSGTAPTVGDRMHPPDGQTHLVKNTTGAFLAVSEPNTTESIVWAIFNPNYCLCEEGGGGGGGGTGTPCKEACVCCVPNMPNTLLLTLDGFVEECCAGLNDDHILTQHPDGGCRWVKCVEDFCIVDGKFCPCDAPLPVSVDLLIEAVFLNNGKDCDCTVFVVTVTLTDPLTGRVYLVARFKEENINEEDCCLLDLELDPPCIKAANCNWLTDGVTPTAHIVAQCPSCRDVGICCECDELQELFVLSGQLRLTISGAFTGVCYLTTQQTAGTCAHWILATTCEALVDLCSYNLSDLGMACVTSGTLEDIQFEAQLSNMGCNFTDAEASDPTPIFGGSHAKNAVEVRCDKQTGFYARFVFPLAIAPEQPNGCNCSADFQYIQFEVDTGLCNCCPESLKVVISGVGGTEPCCVALNDGFLLTCSGKCSWEYFEAAFCGSYDLRITASAQPDCDIEVRVELLEGLVTKLDFTFLLENNPVDCCTINNAPMALVEFIPSVEIPCVEGTIAMELTAICKTTSSGDAPLPNEVKVVITEALGIPAGGSGTAEVYLNGVATGRIITVHANWLFGTTTAALGAEAIVRWFEDENKWVITDLEC